jgi:large subunit ribosomal protein L10
MERALKEKQIDFVKGRMSRMTSAVLTDFRGLTVGEVTSLRDEFRKTGVEYKVVKNTLIKLAIRGTALEPLTKYLVGPTGIAWSYEDPAAGAKVVKAFRKTNEKLTVKCGVVEGEIVSAKHVEDILATMPGKQELRAMLLATLQAPAVDLIRLLQAPAMNFAYLLQNKSSQDGEKA